MRISLDSEENRQTPLDLENDLKDELEDETGENMPSQSEIMAQVELKKQQ